MDSKPHLNVFAMSLKFSYWAFNWLVLYNRSCFRSLLQFDSKYFISHKATIFLVCLLPLLSPDLSYYFFVCFYVLVAIPKFVLFFWNVERSAVELMLP